MSDRTKTLVFKKAIFSSDYKSTLEDLLTSLFQRQAKAVDRIVKVDLLKSIVFASIREQDGANGVFIHIFEFENGGTGTINFSSTTTSAGIEELQPPQNQEFLLNDMVLLIKDNDIIASGMANKNRTLSRCICEICSSLGLTKGETRLEIEDVPNKVKLDELKEFGVSRIDFGITGYLASLPDFRQSVPAVLDMLLTRPGAKEDIRKRANTVGRIHLSRGRFRKDEIEKDVWLTEIGSEVVESDTEEAYTIHLENGKVLTNRNLKLIKRVSVRRYANTVHYQQLENELAIFQKELISEGLIKV